MAWPQVEQRMRFWSSAASWSQPGWTPLWAATAAAVEAAALFSAHLPRGMVKSRLCFASEAAPEEVAAFILGSSLLDA